MHNINYKNRLGLAIAENPYPFFEKLFPETTIDYVGENYRLQPCPQCGHRDCCTITSGKPFIHCLSTGCDLKGYTVDGLVSMIGDRANEIYSVADEVYGIEVPNDRLLRLQAIKAIAVEHYHVELINSKESLQHQSEVRNHSREALEVFKVGLSGNFRTLERALLEKGYSEEEIKDAAIWIPSEEKINNIWIPKKLFVYPYYDRKTGNIVRFNTKGMTEESGNKPNGFSIGPKACFTTPIISKDKVILVEGENDLISLFEAGETSVIALGGKPSREQLEELADLVDGVAAVYPMFDNDEAGKAYIEQINAALPHKMVYSVSYKGKDPDELIKQSGITVDISKLLESATLLPEEGYHLKQTGSNLVLSTRTFSIKARITKRDKDGIFHGNVEFRSVTGDSEFKHNVAIPNFKSKHIHSEYLSALQSKSEEYYDRGFAGKDLAGLIEAFRFSRSCTLLITLMAKTIHSDGDLEKGADTIAKYLGDSVRVEVLRELNVLENCEVDLNKFMPRIKISQSFDIPNNVSRFYFNRVLATEDGAKVLPYLLTSQKELIRLDLFKRKTPQHMLLMNGCQLPCEVPTAITKVEENSLQQRWVDEYCAGNIDERKLHPGSLIRMLVTKLKRFYYHPDPRVYVLLAIWIYGTYAYELFGVFPYIYLTGNKGAGKSTVDAFINAYAFNPKFGVSFSAPSLYRITEVEGGTMILDELENLTSRTKSLDSDMSSVLKGGYSRKGKVFRCNGDNNNQPEDFDPYGPKVISNIFGLDDVTRDRSLEVHFRVIKKSDYSVEKIDKHTEQDKEEIREITSLCCLSVLTNFQEIYKKYEAASYGAEKARTDEIVNPLLALAEFAGPSYVDALVGYCNEVIKIDKEETDEDTPEGAIANIVKDVARELRGLKSNGWVKKSTDLGVPQNAGVVSYDDGFRLNKVMLKILVDSYLPGNKYPFGQYNYYIKRYFGKIAFDEHVPRTQVRLISDEPLAKLIGANPFVPNYRFFYKDFPDVLLLENVAATPQVSQESETVPMAFFLPKEDDEEFDLFSEF